MKIFIYIVFLAVAVLAAYKMVKIITADLTRYVAESECVETKTRLGIERSDIATANGTCWVRKSALNNPLNP